MSWNAGLAETTLATSALAPSKNQFAKWTSEVVQHYLRRSQAADIRETSLVKFSTVPGCTNPKLSFHPWNRAELLYTGPATGWNNEATVSKYGENADGAGY